jgi:hypothetical protein
LGASAVVSALVTTTLAGAGRTTGFDMMDVVCRDGLFITANNQLCVQTNLNNAYESA